MESTHDPITPATDHSATVQRSRTVKRPYVEPQIDELGTVERLTAHNGPLLPDTPNTRALV
ncbi:hypothetical protein [Streptomyces roseoverticillatus]|uniref:Uncharacterized protein n=1 Tax=Streptomyces roseoverticillatus TaxID=66429 RepID=A0ABV3INC7_9ACTN